MAAGTLVARVAQVLRRLAHGTMGLVTLTAPNQARKPLMPNPTATHPATPAAWRTAQPEGHRTALLAGATGLVGRELLALLLADDAYAAVHCVGRRAAPQTHAKLTAHKVDIAAPDALQGLALPPITDVFIALGTTIKVAGSQAAFRAVDFDAVVAVAQAGRSSDAINLGVVSAMGASTRSGIFYNRIKGEMEAAVSALGYTCTVIARPSLIDGDRALLQQAGRTGEGLALVAMRWLAPLTPANYRVIGASRIARALLSSVKAARPGVQVLASGALQKF